MLSAHPFAVAAFLVVAVFRPDAHGIWPARIEQSPDRVGGDTEVTVASGKLARPAFTSGLFRIGPLWFRVAPDAPFRDRLLHARGSQAAVTLTTNAERYIDAEHTTVVSGRPVHETVPSASPIVHLMLLQDVVTGGVAMTFQTTDAVVASRLENYTSNPGGRSRISVVIQVE